MADLKDGKVLCLGCGRRVDGLFSPGHAFACPVANSKRESTKEVAQRG